MKIIKLSAENIKRLSAVEITPKGDVVVIGGKNAAGKSSVLDSIAYALGGQRLIDPEPIRRGQSKAKVSVELDDFIVTRTFTRSGSTLTITTKDGKLRPSPQAILDGLVGKLTFDPLAFKNMEPAAQRKLLQELAGLDFTDLDLAKEQTFAERTEVNRDIKKLEAQLKLLVRHDDVPAEPLSAEVISEELQAAAALRKHTEQAQEEVRRAELDIALGERQIVAHEEDIRELEKQLAEARQSLASLQERVTARKAQLEELRVKLEDARRNEPDVAALQAKMVRVEETNRKVRENLAYDKLATDLQAARRRSEELTQRLNSIECEKFDKIASAKWPIEGLGLGPDGGVTYNGIPFAQCSHSEQLRISVAIGLAVNPKLKVLLVRDGSLLDSDSLRIIAEMAAAAGAQVWVEKVTDSADGVSVLIEDGHVKEVTE